MPLSKHCTTDVRRLLNQSRPRGSFHAKRGRKLRSLRSSVRNHYNGGMPVGHLVYLDVLRDASKMDPFFSSESSPPELPVFQTFPCVVRTKRRTKDGGIKGRMLLTACLPQFTFPRSLGLSSRLLTFVI